MTVIGIGAGGTVVASAETSPPGNAQAQVAEDGFENVGTLTGGKSETITATRDGTKSLTFTKQSNNAGSITITVSCGSLVGGGLELEKDANRGTYSQQGDVILYTYSVKNTTSGTVNQVAITDDKTSVSCPSDALAPSATMICTASYTVQATDVVPPTDSVTNKATATARAAGNTVLTSNTVSVTVNFSPPPPNSAAISLTKTADIETWNVSPTTITYTYLVKNTGNALLTDIKITDDELGTFDCVPSLAVSGAASVCTKQYVTTENDVGKDIVNVATASGMTSQSVTITSEPVSETVFWQASSLTIVKTADQSSFDEVGDVLTYKILVTNTGSSTLEELSVIDTLDKTVECGGVTVLSSGQSVSCTASYTIIQSDIDAGKVTNIATADTRQTAPQSSEVTVKLSVSDDLIERTFESASYNFIAQRLTLLASNGPRLAWLVNRLEGGFGGGNSFNMSSADGGVSGSFAFSSNALRNAVAGDRVVPTADAPRSDGGVNAWIEGQFALYNDDRDSEDDAKGDFFIGYAGVDFEVMERVNIGIMGEIDWMTQDGDGDADIDGTGWMIGPYLSAEIAEGIFLDMRAMGGRTDNSISQEILGNDYDGDFETARWLAEATLSGNYEWDSVTLTPDIRLLHIRENQEDYNVSGGGKTVDVDGNDVVLTQLSSGLRLSHLILTDDMMMRPYIAGRLFWNFDNPGELTIDGEYISTEDVRGAVTIGLDGGSDNMQFGIEGTYDGLFAEDDYAISGRLSFGYRF